MRIDLPQCGFHYCRFQFDGNCTSTGKYEKCEYRYLSEQIEPKRKKGKWIFIHPLQADDEGAYICSNCHRGDWDIKPTDKYCKFCGMAMDIYATLLP